MNSCRNTMPRGRCGTPGPTKRLTSIETAAVPGMGAMATAPIWSTQPFAGTASARLGTGLYAPLTGPRPSWSLDQGDLLTDNAVERVGSRIGARERDRA